MKWLRNWLKTLVRDATRDEIRAQRADDAATVRELVREMTDALEMLHAQFAREASRRARETKKLATEGEAHGVPLPSAVPLDRKSAIRARHLGLTIPAHKIPVTENGQ